MAHPKPIKIFSNVTRGVLFFEGSTVTPKVLGIVNAYINPDISNRIIVERTDQQDNQGRNRRIFSKLQPARVQDVYGNFLLEEGYTFQQVVNYINAQANADLATSQDDFNAYVDPTYDISNGASTGSSTYPFTTLQTAMDTVSGGSKIFVKGVNTITAPLTADLGKSLTIIGGLSTVIGYGEFDPTTTTNIFQLSCETPVHGAVFEFQDLILDNASGWALNVNNATEVNVIDCTFRNNGWDGQGLSLTEVASGDTLGIDSSQAALTAHNALSASQGGAIRINTGLKVTITDNEIKDGNGTIKLIDTGFAEPTPNVFVEGSTIVARNQIFRNLGYGLEMCPRDYDLAYATEGRNGNRNVTMYNNAITDNGNDAVKTTGGKDNTVSLNTFRRNWGAGVHAHSSSNTRIRDLDLADNNRAANSAAGDAFETDSTILINGNYLNTTAAFIAEILNLQIVNTDDITTVAKNGIEIGQSVGTITDAAAIISIDNIGFLNQDFSITNKADLTNINLSIGDCKFINSSETNIRNLAIDSQNNYYELPFSNHTTTVNSIDVEVNYTAATIIIKEGVNGETLNSYSIQQLVAFGDPNGTVQILEKNTNRIQLGGLQHTHVFINGAQATGTLQEVVNQLNGAFTETDPGTSTGTTTLIVDFSGAPLDPLSGTNTTSVSGGTGFQANGNGENNGTVFGALFSSAQTISAGGEYFTFEVTGVGDFSMGLFDLAEPTTSIYSITSAGTGEGTYAYGYQFAHVFGRTPVGPWKTAGKNNSFISMDGWTGGSDDQKFSTAAGGYDAWYGGETMEFKVGLNADNFIQIDYLNTRLNQYVPITRSSYVGNSLSGFGLLLKLGDTATTITDIRRHLIDQDAVTALSGLDSVALNFRWIESPDGAFTFPLFDDENAAKYVDENILDFFPALTQFTPGSGDAQGETFIDEDPVSNIWYEPTSVNYTFSANPFNFALSSEWVSPYVTWNEIQTTTDASAAPTSFPDTTLNVTEGDSVNFQVAPSDATFTTTVTDLPDGLTYNSGTGFITGTVGIIPVDVNTQATITRSNSYGSSTGGLTFNITAVDSPFSGFTQFGGNFDSPNRMQLDYDALLRYDSYLSAGQKVTWTHDKDAPEPMFGLLNSTGNTAVAQLSDDVNYYDVLGSGSYDFAGTGKWDLRFRILGDNIGGTIGKDLNTGWNANTPIVGSTDVNDNATFEIVNDSADNYLKLYRNDVLMLSSANTYPAAGVQFFVAAFDNDSDTDVFIPSDFALVSQAFGTTEPPAGFTNPILQGEMTNSTLMGVGSADAAVQLTEKLKINHRFIVPEDWVEANALPHIDSVDNKVFFGVPKDTADWTDIGLNDDFHTALRLNNNLDGGSRHQSTIQTRGTNPLDSVINVNSLTDALYNYAIEYDGHNLNILADTTLNDLSTEYSAVSGGTFDRALVYDSQFGANTLSANIEEIPLVIAADDGGQVNLTTSGLSQVRIPWDSATTVLAAQGGFYGGVFKTGNVASDYDIAGNNPTGFTASDLPTFTAGSTYTFIYHPSMDAGDHIELRDSNNTVYTTGSAAYDNTSDGDPDATSGYKGFTWTVPADVPPLTLYYYSANNLANDGGRGLNFSGSTYTASPSGIDLEGPAANQTGTNITDAGDYGWASVDDQLAAGERIVMDNAFLTDLLAEMGDQYEIRIGLKGDNWDNTDQSTKTNTVVSGEVFKGDLQLRIHKTSSNNIRFQLFKSGTNYNSMLVNTVALHATMCAFIEVTSDGNNIRMGFGRNGYQSITQGDESTVIYSAWSAYKGETGDQGYGITSLDVMFLVTALNNVSDDYDGANVDWTGLSEIATPTAPANATSWTKAVDFSGGNEHLITTNTNAGVTALSMYGRSTTTAFPTTSGYTSNDSSAQPWACACVFKTDSVTSNQHIWNHGEGAGSTDDNIYLRMSGTNGDLYFGWGRQGSLNEIEIGNIGGSANASHYWGIYIAHNGTRLSSSNATAANLADVFDIRLMGSNDTTPWGALYDVGTLARWTSSSATTGGRMDREVSGGLTIGGRGSNRNFHGKVASMVVTTLKKNSPMPTDVEIEKMILDPTGWLTDYKVGQSYGSYNGGSASTNFQFGNLNTGFATQVWLMGDGTNDSFSNGIRNQVYSTEQNYVKLQFNSMVSSDIETVTIPSLP